MLATLVAVAAYYFAGEGLTALVATGIVMLLSGMTLVGAMQDAVTGYLITAVSRLAEAVFLTAGIVTGILAGLQVAEMVGVTIELQVNAAETVTMSNHALAMPLAVAGAALAELVLIGLGAVGFGQVAATGVAAAGVGFLATLISIRRKAPALLTVTAGIMPLLPGRSRPRQWGGVGRVPRFASALPRRTNRRIPSCRGTTWAAPSGGRSGASAVHRYRRSDAHR